MVGISIGGWSSVARVALAVLVTAALVAGVGGFLLFDHPLAQAGFGQADGSSFSNFEGDNGYSVVVESGADPEKRRRVEQTQYANGSYVTDVEALGARNLSRDGVVRRQTVRDAKVGYRARHYENGTRPRTVAPHLYYDRDENTVYERGEYDEVDTMNRHGYERLFSKLAYARNGTQTWNGEKHERYDALGEKSPLRRLTAPAEVHGYILVDDDREILYARLSSGDSLPLVYETYAEPLTEFPSWVSSVEERFIDSNEGPRP